MKTACLIFLCAAPLAAQNAVEPKIPSIELVPGLKAPVFQLPGSGPRPLELNIHDLNNIGRPPKQMIVMRPQKPKICSIPLRTIVPNGNYPVRVAKPPAQTVEMPRLNLPAPACDEVKR